MAHLHLSSVNALFDASPLPLLLFGVSGQVNFANRAAQAHPGKPVQAMGGKDVIKKLIKDATLGVIKLPYEADIEMVDGSLMHGHFMPGPSGLDVAFVMASNEVAGSTTPGTQLQDTIALLQAEVAPPIQYLLSQLEALGQPSPPALAQAAQILTQRLARLSDLIEVFGQDIVHNNDRVELAPLLKEVCAALAAKSSTQGVQFKFAELRQTLPPVYGNLRLLKRAFYECIDNAVTYSRQQSGSQRALEVEVRFTFSGQHILVGIRNQGVTAVRVSQKDRLHPFAQSDKPSAAGVDTLTAQRTRLGLPLVQRIVALHGGNMRLSSPDADTVQILMEFPTGAPVRGSQNLDKAQAQAYAKDLAQLMQRRRKAQK